MPQSIKMYRIETYPEEFPVESSEVNPGYTNVTFKTIVKHLGESEYSRINLEKLQIIHHTGDTFEGKGILEDGSIYDIVAVSTIEKFPCFVKDKSFIYTSGTKRMISEQALRRLRKYPKHENKLIAKPVQIDLVSFKKELESSRGGAIIGGWFRGMQIENVEVAYLGGGTVTESTDWEKYENSGGLISALRIDLPTTNIDDEEDYIKILITKDGNCVIYKTFGELEMLRIAIPLFELAEKHILSSGRR